MGFAEGSSMAVAVGAGFNSLVLQASMQVIANGGDVGAALEAMASIDTIRSLATAMLTAGLAHEALGRFAESDLANSIDGLAEELTEGAIKAGINTGVGTAINGGDLGENLVANLRGAAISTLGAQGASEIGTAFRSGDIDLASRYIAHAALGGAMDLALGGDGTSGAVGAVAGELVADTFVATYVNAKLSDKNAFVTPEEFQKEAEQLQDLGVDFARLGAGLAAAVIDGDMEIAAQTGANAAENNAVFCLAIATVLVGLEVADKAITAYDAWRLAQALNDGDTELAAEIGTEISIGLATEAIPGNKIALMLAKSLDSVGLVALGVKIIGKVGDNVATVLTKVDDIAQYAIQKGKLPDNFITKAEAKKLGWTPSKGNLHEVAPGKSIGGDVFKDKDGMLPSAPGRTWIEADINYTQGYRGNERLIISNDGLVYKTTDHYKTLTKVLE
jgi:filamentous hemagglutinin